MIQIIEETLYRTSTLSWDEFISEKMLSKKTRQQQKDIKQIEQLLMQIVALLKENNGNSR